MVPKSGFECLISTISVPDVKLQKIFTVEELLAVQSLYFTNLIVLCVI